MKSSTSFGFSSSLLFFFIVAASIAVYSEARTCLYELIVVTGDGPDDGTNSRISVTLGDQAGERVEIPDLRQWGTMLPGHKYFQSGKHDLFIVKSPCFRTPAPVCSITVTSDGSGEKPGWYLREVEVITYTTTPARYRINFDIGRWLTKDEPPFELTASENNCPSSIS